MKTSSIILLLAGAFAGAAPAVVSAADSANDQTVTVKGEVVDMVCYTDSGLSGKDHADCAKTCITAGLPVGLKGEDGKVYLLIGDHNPMNEELATYAAHTFTVKDTSPSPTTVNLIQTPKIDK